MRVRGKIYLFAFTILLDYKSTHNFVSKELAEKVGLHPSYGIKFQVMLASGEKFTSLNKCAKVQIILQGIPLSVDFYLLPLERHEVVLGTQWLRTLGPILRDFSKLKMISKVVGNEVVLQGLRTPENKVINNL
ncbi:RVP_2 domain-containing protein [Cephalotus follicularis]|uniref:RVP_2 domain-containing protein n=1 Tax=Cephalotus follicularis TaxID=3775 RepID=A0A1Q3CII7_CEPFO|nr:RVP_2 domain-containing protein [Cephalotus follicularis]